MWETIELREIRVFLVLAEELHFGRTADQLDLTQSRVSQSLRALEHKLGEQLVHRTSRRVALTPAGEQFQNDAGATYHELTAVLRRTHDASRSLDGRLRLGQLNAASGGPHMIAIVATFEAEHPGTRVDIVELPFRDRLGPLRRGEIDVMTTRLPLKQPDLVVGPIISKDARVLAVARDHPLANRSHVSIEDLADYEAASPEPMLPKELADALLPLRTPTGRPITRRREELHDLSELITLIARGKVIHATVAPFGEYFAHQGVTYVPITDMAPLSSALVWRRRDPNPRLRELIRITKQVLSSNVTQAASDVR